MTRNSALISVRSTYLPSEAVIDLRLPGQCRPAAIGTEHDRPLARRGGLGRWLDDGAGERGQRLAARSRSHCRLAADGRRAQKCCRPGAGGGGRTRPDDRRTGRDRPYRARNMFMELYADCAGYPVDSIIRDAVALMYGDPSS